MEVNKLSRVRGLRKRPGERGHQKGRKVGRKKGEGRCSFPNHHGNAN